MDLSSVVFNGVPISNWVYSLSKQEIDNPKDPLNNKRAELAVLLNALENAEIAEQERLDGTSVSPEDFQEAIRMLRVAPPSKEECPF